MLCTRLQLGLNSYKKSAGLPDDIDFAQLPDTAQATHRLIQSLQKLELNYFSNKSYYDICIRQANICGPIICRIHNKLGCWRG